MRADLHMHTLNSDGKFPLEEVIKIAKNAKMDYIAITDHDFFTDTSDYQDGIKIIMGIELTTSYNDESIHVLAYFKDKPTLAFLDKLKEMRELRRVRAYKILDNLTKYHGIVLNPDFIDKGEAITRGGISREIISQGYNYSKGYIFANFLGKNCPAYIPAIKIDTRDGIKLIHDAGGLAVLAHPMVYKEENMRAIVNFDILDGIEAIYPHYEGEKQKYRDIARKHQLFVTAGSDFHEFIGIDGDDGTSKHGNIGSVYLTNGELNTFLKVLYER